MKCRALTCNLHQQYDSSSSSSYLKNDSYFEVGYGFGGDHVAGYISQDTLSIGGLSVSRQDFAEATDMTGESFKDGKQDGTLGLGFHMHAVSFFGPTFLQHVQPGLAVQASLRLLTSGPRTTFLTTKVIASVPSLAMTTLHQVALSLCSAGSSYGSGTPSSISAQTLSAWQRPNRSRPSHPFLGEHRRQ